MLVLELAGIACNRDEAMLGMLCTSWALELRSTSYLKKLRIGSATWHRVKASEAMASDHVCKLAKKFNLSRRDLDRILRNAVRYRDE